MNKLLITRWGDQILTALTENGKFLSFNLEPAEQTGLLGNIYIGKVKNIVKNINSAFIDLGNGQTGYYSLTDNKTICLQTPPGSSARKRKSSPPAQIPQIPVLKQKQTRKCGLSAREMKSWCRWNGTQLKQKIPFSPPT